MDRKGGLPDGHIIHRMLFDLIDNDGFWVRLTDLKDRDVGGKGKMKWVEEDGYSDPFDIERVASR